MVCAAQAPVVVVQLTEPDDVRFSVPSMPVAELVAVPVQPCGQSSCAVELAVLGGPAAGCHRARRGTLGARHRRRGGNRVGRCA